MRSGRDQRVKRPWWRSEKTGGGCSPPLSPTSPSLLPSPPFSPPFYLSPSPFSPSFSPPHFFSVQRPAQSPRGKAAGKCEGREECGGSWGKEKHDKKLNEKNSIKKIVKSMCLRSSGQVQKQARGKPPLNSLSCR